MKRERTTIETDRAPRAIGPYSQAVCAAGLVWVSGQIPLDPETGAMVKGDTAAQARRVLENMRGVLEAAGASLEGVLKTTIYLADLADFESVNAVYAEFFPTAPPARACVEVSRMPKGARVEIDAVALSSPPS